MDRQKTQDNAAKLWDTFTKTGKIGAYLTYRAIKEHEKEK